MIRTPVPALPCLSALLAFCLSALISVRAVDAGSPRLREVAPGVVVGAAADLGGDASWAARVVLIHPAHARFQVQFDEEAPLLSAWKARFPDALVLLNGSYYSLEKRLRPTCDLVSGGRPERGAGCRRSDALVFVSGASAAGAPQLIPSAAFTPGRWTEAMKSFPALVHAGVPGCSGKLYCDHPGRASAIAQLRDGRIALFAAGAPAPLRAVARFFVEKLGAEEAVSLDGGPETTLAVRGDAPEEGIATERVPLPLLLVVSAPREPGPFPTRPTAP